jgi:5-methyltetrahydrofolate corrinoid/iron sulfur protein methyltransferase
MIIVGEKINSSRPAITEAVARRDAEFVIRAARLQAEAGARFIDVNAGTFLDREVDYLCWLVETIQSGLDVPLCLDSANPQALAAAVKRHKGEPMINSISLDEGRFRSLLPVITSRPCHVVALCTSESSMPVTAQDRVRVGSKLVTKLLEAGIPLDRIYVDPLVQPLAIDAGAAAAALGAMQQIIDQFPGIKTILGLSNISFGLPGRHFLNRSFLTLAVGYGLSAAILDPTDKQLMASLLAVQMFLGKDDCCDGYIAAYQSGRIIP